MTESVEAATLVEPDSNRIPVIRPRREPFEYGLLPIQKLILSADPIQFLMLLKRKLVGSDLNNRVNPDLLSDSMQIPIDHARLLLDTLASVHHSRSEDIESVGADPRDLLLFLYVQSYKKLLPRGHKDSAAVADVWPSMSAFDGCLSAMSPLRLARSNSRRFMPSQADEEAHQLSYLQKNLTNIISLLAETVEGKAEGGGEDQESLVLTADTFEHLGFLIQFADKEYEGKPLSKVAPFFANSEANNSAVPVAAAEVLDWLLQTVAASLESVAERISAKEVGPDSNLDQDLATGDAGATSNKSTPSAKLPIFVEGISKSSFVTQASNLKSSSVKVINCHDSVIYILAPLRYATIYGCSDATIVLGAVGEAVRVEHCERVHVVAVAKRVCIANCRECTFFLGVNHRPVIIGDNNKLQVAPYNTFYSHLEEHMAEARIDSNINRWNEPLTLGGVDQHDSLSHSASAPDARAEAAAHLDPNQFTNFLIPDWLDGESKGSTKANPFALPDAYFTAQLRNQKNLEETKQSLKDTPLEENQKRELSCALHVLFKDWLYASGNIRQLYCLQGE